MGEPLKRGVRLLLGCYNLRLNMSRPFFTLGFVLGLGLVLAANVYSYHIAEPPCCDFSVPFGVPFPLGQTGGFIDVTRFMLLGVIADVIVGLIASVGFAWMFAKSFPSIINRFRQLAQWHVATRSH